MCVTQWFIYNIHLWNICAAKTEILHGELKGSVKFGQMNVYSFHTFTQEIKYLRPLQQHTHASFLTSHPSSKNKHTHQHTHTHVMCISNTLPTSFSPVSGRPCVCLYSCGLLKCLMPGLCAILLHSGHKRGRHANIIFVHMNSNKLRNAVINENKCLLCPCACRKYNTSAQNSTIKVWRTNTM